MDFIHWAGGRLRAASDISGRCRLERWVPVVSCTSRLPFTAMVASPGRRPFLSETLTIVLPSTSHSLPRSEWVERTCQEMLCAKWRNITWHRSLYFILSHLYAPSPNAMVNQVLVDAVYRVCGGHRAAPRKLVTVAGWRGASQSACALVGYPVPTLIANF